MKISARVIPNSSRNSIAVLEDGTYKIKITTAPLDGKANVAVVKLLSKHLSIPQSRISILRGHTSKQKLIEIEDY
jgi:uncharacterized protein (TIGR00251 family)